MWATGAGASGRSVEPLHRVVPGAAARDPDLYAALALIDALRVGRARDRRLASEQLEHLLARPERDAAWLVRQRESQAGPWVERTSSTASDEP